MDVRSHPPPVNGPFNTTVETFSTGCFAPLSEIIFAPNFERSATKKQLMKTRNLTLLTTTLAFAVSLLTTGCQNTLYKSETQKVKPSGAVETRERTITENPDGTITRTDEKKTTNP